MHASPPNKNQDREEGGAAEGSPESADPAAMKNVDILSIMKFLH